MITVSNLSKSYGSTLAVNGISFEVKAGEVFGLIGPNGAGKTTTIAMMAGLLAPDSGSIEFDGLGNPIDPKTRTHIGLAPQSLAIYDPLTAQENLTFFASLYGLAGAKLHSRVAWALELAGLADRRKDFVRTFSGGMKRRLNLACALVHEPKVVFLDEPTVGVDSQSRNHLFDSVQRLRDEGLTVVYTTHYMEEAERLCDRVAIMDQGKILAMDSVPGLISTYGGLSMIVVELLGAPDGFSFRGAVPENSELKFGSSEPFEDIAKLSHAGLRVKSLRVEQPDLEGVFLSLTGKTLRD